MSEQQQDELLNKIGAILQKHQRQIEDQMTDFKAEVRQQMSDMRAEMRNRDDQRHDEIMALRKETDAKFEKMDAKFEKMDAKFEKMDAKFDRVVNHAQNLFIAATVGIAAIIIAIVLKQVKLMRRQFVELEQIQQVIEGIDSFYNRMIKTAKIDTTEMKIFMDRFF